MGLIIVSVQISTAFSNAVLPLRKDTVIRKL